MTATTTDFAADGLDDRDVCRDPFDEGCTAPLDDGEGWNGAYGNCADREYANEFNDNDDDVDEEARA
jgi:hypothetical protein